MPSFSQYTLTYADASAIISDGTDLWVTQNNYITKVSAADGTRTYYNSTDVSNACYQMCKLGTNIWVADYTKNKWHKVKISDGSITSYSAPTSASPLGIATDGTWLYVCGAGTNKIYKVDPADGSVNATWSPTAGTTPARITYASNGDLYYTGYSSGKIGRMDTTGTVIGDYGSSLANATYLHQSDDDGNIWFTCQQATRKVGKCTLSGTVTTYGTADGLDASCDVRGIWPGPVGSNKLYVLDYAVAKLYEVTTGGVITAITAPLTQNQDVCLGADGNLWYARANSAAGQANMTRLILSEKARPQIARQAVTRSATR